MWSQIVWYTFGAFWCAMFFAPCSEEFYCCKFFSSIRFFLQQTQKEILDKNKEVQKLENELIEREDFKEFQNKSVEYQQSSKNKMKELERKVVNLFKDLE
ncbi:22332_t:CDS:2 [Gigaspora rosea]|nr:22332_t:CDS:2 [Gigaspora rosea]